MANIVVYASSSIAIIKTNILIDLLIENGHTVTTLVTTNVEKNAVNLKLNFNKLNEKFSFNDNEKEKYPSEHIKLSKITDLVIVAPASLNTMAKYASGISDEINLSFLYAFNGPIIFAPAMNDIMWKSAIERNIINKISKLKNNFLIGPVIGPLYEGYSAIGRMSEAKEIAKLANNILNLKGKVKIAISYGSSRIYLDKIRFITNGATGLFAQYIAKELNCHGIIADLFSAADYSNEQMVELVKEYDIYISTAAFANYQTSAIDEKVSGLENWTINLSKAIDVIDSLSNLNPALKIFAFKYDDDRKKAIKKMNGNSNIKAILWNKIGAMGNQNISGELISKTSSFTFKDTSKYEIAKLIVEEILSWI